MRVRVPLFPRWARWALVVLVAGALFYRSVVVVPPDVPPPPGLTDVAPLDKWLHVLAYAGLGGALAYALADGTQPRPHRAATVFVLAAGFGLGIELVQGLVAYRYMGPGDALANAVGAGLSLAWYLLEPRVAFVRVWTSTEGTVEAG